MYIKSIELQNFRNYESLSMEFHPEKNILYGDNAQGKTNILEALYYCGMTKSHKGSKEKEIIKINENESHIRMIIEKNGIERRIDMHLKKNKGKGVAIDGISVRKSSEVFGLTNIVFFSPEDLGIIKHGPSERRRFVDMELCQLDKIYFYDLGKYNQIINQRNNLLKQIGHQQNLIDTLDIWDTQLLEYGSRIIERRRKHIEQLNQIIMPIHEKLSGGRERLILEYEQNVTCENFKSKLLQNRDRDLFQKITTVGPHRDDIRFCIDDVDIRKYGSQGQQRTSALSLKLAEIELIKKSVGDNPILLLDDVLSELDRNRQNYLLDSIQDIQTIITCTGLEEFIRERLKINQVYKVINGSVTKESV
ncbi:MAG: DNA replication/repair protein RecF [Lachnospiraceae bacterium]|nr:DNA replication/repair protein RecF [Lachnospiraceae bacterium]